MKVWAATGLPIFTDDGHIGHGLLMLFIAAMLGL